MGFYLHAMDISTPAPALQQVCKLVCVYARLTEDRGQSSTFDYLVQRDCRTTSSSRIPHDDMTTPRPGLREASPFKRFDHLRAGQYREPIHPTLTRTGAVTGWASRAASSSAVASSRYSSAASRTFASASSTVSPWLIAPGSSAT